MQGGAIALAQQAQKRLAQIPPDLERPDIVLATDMVHLPVWIGLLRGVLPGTLPLVCYMHENQLTYPWRAGEKPDLTYAMINWLSQLTADLVLFNSRYHLESWFTELPRLLKQYPDYSHPRACGACSQSCHLHLWGLRPESVRSEQQSEAELDQPPTGKVQAPLILWNQRWEYKQASRPFLCASLSIARSGCFAWQ